MVLYQFKCKECGHEQEEWFEAAVYDKKMTSDGRLKRKRCENCKTISLYRHITRLPGVMGGTKGYLSMERWMKLHPEHAQRKEAEMLKTLAQRREARNRRIDKQDSGQRRQDRHKGYGDGQKEDRLEND